MLIKTDIPPRRDGTIRLELPGRKTLTFVRYPNGDLACDVPADMTAMVLGLPHFSVVSVEPVQPEAVAVSAAPAPIVAASKTAPMAKKKHK